MSAAFGIGWKSMPSLRADAFITIMDEIGARPPHGAGEASDGRANFR